MLKTKLKMRIGSRDFKDAIFFASMVIIPSIQFIIFYICVKINSISLAFQVYDGDKLTWSFSANFQKFFYDLQNSELFVHAIKNSLVSSVFTVAVGISIALIFSLYIYRKQFGSKLFKVLLFMPSVVSSLVMTKVFTLFVDVAYPRLMMEYFGIKAEALLGTESTMFPTIIFYSLWSGFGAQILLYVGAMSGISESVSEAAKLDGCNIVQESWYITLPLIYPTITVYVTTGVATIFTNQLNLYQFFGDGAEYNIQTMGYWFYNQTSLATSIMDMSGFAYISAVGLLFTFVAIPMTYLVRWAMNKWGPKTE